MTLIDHAKAELDLIGLTEDAKDSMDRMMRQNILSVITLFSGQGHSGGTASYAIQLITRLLRYEPITALTGADDEWRDMSEISDRKMWQNLRCSRVIKEADGKCYDLEGKIFVNPDGSQWTNRESWVEVTFPYIPKHEFVNRTQEELDADNG